MCYSYKKEKSSPWSCLPDGKESKKMGGNAGTAVEEAI
jgi:hypothetical protein